MISSEREHILRELSDVDRSNLRLGRVTRQALWEAARRQGICMGGEHILRLADELNDMLEAAGGPRCWSCGQPAEGRDARGAKLHWCKKCYDDLHRAK